MSAWLGMDEARVRAILDAVGGLIQEARHHHAGRGMPLDGPGILPAWLTSRLVEIERLTTVESVPVANPTQSAHPCVDCGEPTLNPERCRDCDIEWLIAQSSCRKCGTFIFDSAPKRDQHQSDCSLRESDTYHPRDEAEIQDLIARRRQP